MKVLWSPLALERVEEIVLYIANDSPIAATRWSDRLFDSVGELADFPSRGRVVPEVRDPSLRELIFGEYRVIYRLRTDEIWVLTVRHGKRLLDETELDD